MKSKGDPKRKPRAALANPADPLEVGTDREALIGAKPELRPCRFEIRPVDAESLADDQRLGHLLALAPRIIPAAVGIVPVDLVPSAPGSASAARGWPGQPHLRENFSDR